MPLSFDEATKRYESYVQNIQDSTFTIESYMGTNQGFSFHAPQVIGNLDQVDLTKEEKTISLQIQVLEEYKKMISYERKRRLMADVIQAKQHLKDFKTQLKTKLRSDRVTTNPHSQYKQQGQAAPAPAEPANLHLINEEE